MRVIVSVQPQSKSTRGLVHYIAHSKIAPSHEQYGGRAIFNDRADVINVQQANFSLKQGVSTDRPKNEDLFHLVISFRPEDFKKLGSDEKERRRSLREISRETMRGLEKTVGAESLDWVAAIHRNTDNPHVHFAIAKRYISLQKNKYETIKRLPTAALPHYDYQGQDHFFLRGVLMETAERKMDEIIARNPVKEKTRPEHISTNEIQVEKVLVRTHVQQPLSRARQPVIEEEYSR